MSARDYLAYAIPVTLLISAACALAALPEPQRLDPATPADSRVGQECRTWSMDLRDGRLVVVPTRPACWTPPQEMRR